MSTADEARAEARSRAGNHYPGGLSVDGILQRGYEHGFREGAEWQSTRKPEAAPPEPAWGAGLVAPGGSSGPQSAGDRDAVEESLGKSFVAAPTECTCDFPIGGHGLKCPLYEAAPSAAQGMSTPREVLLAAADHFAQAHARLGGEMYPDDLRAYADNLPEDAPSDTEAWTKYAETVSDLIAETPEIQAAFLAGRTSQPIQVEVTDDMVEKAARGIFADEQCDRRQKATPESLEENWQGRLGERDQDEYRSLARAALSAALGGGNHAD